MWIRERKYIIERLKALEEHQNELATNQRKIIHHLKNLEENIDLKLTPAEANIVIAIIVLICAPIVYFILELVVNQS